jgi:diacylglycerol kinase family enzyme
MHAEQAAAADEQHQRAGDRQGGAEEGPAETVGITRQRLDHEKRGRRHQPERLEQDDDDRGPHGAWRARHEQTLTIDTLRGVRILVVVNPHATATSARERDVLAHALGSEAQLQIEHTANRGHAAALACRAMRDGVDIVVALGGDGTVNEVVNGLLTDGVHGGVPALGVVPVGSTNVFARALGLPNDPVEATGALLDALRTGRGRPISLGRLDERWFAFAAGVGLDAAIVEAVERARRRGERSTHALYARVGLREFWAMDRRHPRLCLELPDGGVVDGLFYAIVANADPWTYLGNRALRPTPNATFDSGLEVYARRRMGTLGVALALVRMTRAEPKSVGRGAIVHHDLSGFRLRADPPIAVQVDGDLLGPRETMRFCSVPRALTVVC